MKHSINAVGVIFEDDKGEVLVLRRHSKSREGNTWGLVGGNIDDDEDRLTAAVRETAEEINHSVAPNDLKFINKYEWQQDDAIVRFAVFKYKVKKKEVDIDLDTDENTEFLWADPKVLCQRSDLMAGLYLILKDEYSV